MPLKEEAIIDVKRGTGSAVEHQEQTLASHHTPTSNGRLSYNKQHVENDRELCARAQPTMTTGHKSAAMASEREHGDAHHAAGFDAGEDDDDGHTYEQASISALSRHSRSRTVATTDPLDAMLQLSFELLQTSQEILESTQRVSVINGAVAQGALNQEYELQRHIETLDQGNRYLTHVAGTAHDVLQPPNTSGGDAASDYTALPPASPLLSKRRSTMMQVRPRIASSDGSLLNLAPAQIALVHARSESISVLPTPRHTADSHQPVSSSSLETNQRLISTSPDATLHGDLPSPTAVSSASSPSTFLGSLFSRRSRASTGSDATSVTKAVDSGAAMPNSKGQNPASPVKTSNSVGSVGAAAADVAPPTSLGRASGRQSAAYSLLAAAISKAPLPVDSPERRPSTDSPFSYKSANAARRSSVSADPPVPHNPSQIPQEQPGVDIAPNGTSPVLAHSTRHRHSPSAARVVPAVATVADEFAVQAHLTLSRRDASASSSSSTRMVSSLSLNEALQKASGVPARTTMTKTPASLSSPASGHLPRTPARLSQVGAPQTDARIPHHHVGADLQIAAVGAAILQVPVQGHTPTRVASRIAAEQALRSQHARTRFSRFSE